MSQEKYIGMDVHQATVSTAVMDVHGKLLMECLLETRASTIVEFIEGLQGPLALTFLSPARRYNAGAVPVRIRAASHIGTDACLRPLVHPLQCTSVI